jgi:HupE / UreJ protein
LLLGWCVPFVPSVSAHEVRPAYLELTERAPGEFDVLWKVPAMGGTPLAGEEIPHPQPAPADDPGPTRTLPCGCPAPTQAQLSRGVLPIHPSLPRDAEVIALPRSERLFGAVVQRWTIRVPHGLEGREVGVHELSATMVDVLVRIAFKDGRVVSRLLRPDAPSFVLTRETAGARAGGFLRLGIEHILTGIDHLLFILGLLLLVNGFGRLIKTVTAFTIAHSVTLSLAALGFVRFPPAPVEAVIALSIAFVAREVVLRARGGPATLAQRQPWLVAFTFGLLHGFGFAGGLTAVGLPAAEVPLALLLFSVGVEIGHFSFVTVAVALVALARRVTLSRNVSAWNWLRPLPGYGIGAAAAFWLVGRLIVCW